MPPSAEQIERLRMMAAATSDPVLSEDELLDVLARNGLVDDDGREPQDDEWVPTYALGAAAQDAWLLKAGKVAHRVTASDGALNVTRSDLHKHCLAMAELYGRRRLTTVVIAGVGGSRQRTALPAFNSDVILPPEPWQPGGAS